MTSAAEKNAQALKALFGSAPLAHRLAETRLAVVAPHDHQSESGRLLAEFLADSLARLWPNIDFVGAGAESNVETAGSAASSGGGGVEGYAVRWAPPYHCVVSVGCDAPDGGAATIRIGADGWMSKLGPRASCGDSPNPAGPAFAAAIAAAQVFLRVFLQELRGSGAEPLDEFEFDLRTICGSPDMEVQDLDLDETHVFGVGAVTHGMLALLLRWPSRVSGTLHLVDRDIYGKSNGQRYGFMRDIDQSNYKVDMVKQRLNRAHPDLVVNSYRDDLNTYCAIRGYGAPLARLVVGLDSAEARRQSALKYPKNCMNMWTEGVRVGAGRYALDHGGACLACDYLEDLSKPYDEVAQIHRDTQLRPDLVRNLLDTGRGLTEQEAQVIASHRGLAATNFVGEPLRSVLPVLCATGAVTFAQTAETTDVPFAFSSLMAGVAGFMMLLRDIFDPAPLSEAWTEHIFKRPSPHMYRHRPHEKDCVACALHEVL